jgi:hypothetical protein
VAVDLTSETLGNPADGTAAAGARHQTRQRRGRGHPDVNGGQLGFTLQADFFWEIFVASEQCVRSPLRF